MSGRGSSKKVGSAAAQSSSSFKLGPFKMSVALGLGGVFLLVAIVVIVLIATGCFKKSSSSAAAASPSSKASSRRSASQVGARSGAAQAVRKAGGAAADGGSLEHSASARRAATDSLEQAYASGQTANSQSQPASTVDVRDALQTSLGDMNSRSLMMDPKQYALRNQSMSDGQGLLITAEQASRIQSPDDFLALAQQMAPREFEHTVRNCAQQADQSGIDRSRVDVAGRKVIASQMSGLSTQDLGQFAAEQDKGQGRAGGATDLPSLERAIGSQNMQYLTQGREQYNQLINRTLVAPQDPVKQAALLALIHKIPDSAVRAQLLARFGSLSSAAFANAKKAQQALTDGGTGYIAFQDVKDPRGTVASLGARYRFGDGGDLSRVFFDEMPVTTVNKQRLASCGFATTQAYEYAHGRDSGIERA